MAITLGELTSILKNQTLSLNKGKEKFHRAASLARKIGKGILEIESRGNLPLLLDSKYIKEWKKDSSVRFLRPIERPAFAIQAREGKLFQQNHPYCTKGEPGKPSSHAFVLSPQNQLYAAPIQPGKFHHSSFCAGGAVTFAGEIETDSQGKIVTLSSRSGHYRPQKQHLLQALRILENWGIDLKSIELQEYDSLNPNRFSLFPSAKNYLDTLGSCSPERIISF